MFSKKATIIQFLPPVKLGGNNKLVRLSHIITPAVGFPLVDKRRASVAAPAPAPIPYPTVPYPATAPYHTTTPHVVNNKHTLTPRSIAHTAMSRRIRWAFGCRISCRNLDQTERGYRACVMPKKGVVINTSVQSKECSSVELRGWL